MLSILGELKCLGFGFRALEVLEGIGLREYKGNTYCIVSMVVPFFKQFGFHDPTRYPNYDGDHRPDSASWGN